MNISELMLKELILFDDSIRSKDELFDSLSQKLEQQARVTNHKKFKNDLLKREKETSTGIEAGFGIPHAKSKYVTQPTIVFAHTASISDYLGLDDEPIECVFMIAVPKKSQDIHLDILSALSRRLMDQAFREKIKGATSADELLEIINA